MGLSNDGGSKRWVFVTARAGQFEVFHKERAEGERLETFNTLDGILTEIAFYMRPSENYADQHTMRIVLEDGDTMYALDAGFKHPQGVSTFSRMFAGHSHAFAKGERIRLRTKQNDQNDKVGSCFVDAWDPEKDDWKSLMDQYKKLGPDEAFEAVSQHDAFNPDWKPKAKKGSQAAGGPKTEPEEKREFIGYVTNAKGWPAWAPNARAYANWFCFVLKREICLEDLDGATWAYMLQCAQKCVAVEVVPKELSGDNVVAEFNPLGDDAGQTQQPAVTESQAEPKPEAKPVETSAKAPEPEVAAGSESWHGTPTASLPSPVPESYKWKPTKWYMPRQLETRRTDRQSQMAEETFGKKFGGLFPNPDVACGQVRFALLRGFKMPIAHWDSMAAFTLYNDFLGEATEEQVLSAQVDGEELDPFKDE